MRRVFFVLLSLFSANVWAEITIQQWQSAQNVPVYFVESHNLPIVDVAVSFSAGSALDSPDKAGVANLTQALLNKGAGDKDENALSEKWADLGALLGGGVSRLNTELNLRTLKEKQSEAVELFLDVLTRPFFLEKVFQRERANLRLELQDALTRPNILTRRAFTRALYPDHPYGYLVSTQTLDRITREDLLLFHQRFYVAQNAKIIIVGDLSQKEAENLALKIARELPSGELAPTVSAPPPKKEAEFLNILHPATQSHLLMGQVTIARDHPDYFPLLAGNYILGGGGFASRLMQKVRDKEGLAYSVYSAFSAGVNTGTFEIALQTEQSQAQKALLLVQQIVKDCVANGVTQTELSQAKAFLSGSFPLNLDSNQKVFRQVVHIAQQNLPLDTLNTWQEKINAVTLEEVREALKKHIQPQTFLTVQTDVPQ